MFIPSWRILAAISARLFSICIVSLVANSCASRQTTGEAGIEMPMPFRTEDSLALAWTDSVNLSLYHCTRALENNASWSFYLIGELHAYNAPSSRFADTVLACLQPALVLSEGAGDAVKSSKLMSQYGSAMRGLFGEIGYNEAEISRLAEQRGIPIVWLEQMDSTTGVYSGVTVEEAGDLRLLVRLLETQNRQSRTQTQQLLKMMLEDPESMYRWLVSAAVKAGIDTTRLANLQQPESGILDARNRIMAASALKYLTPASGCVLIRFGDGHSAGMIDEFGKHGCTCESVKLRDFLLGGP